MAADTAQHHYIGSPRPPEHSKPSSLEDQYNELGNPLPDSPNASVELSAAAPLSPKAPVVMPSLQQAASQSEASSRGRKKFEAAQQHWLHKRKTKRLSKPKRKNVLPFAVSVLSSLLDLTVALLGIIFAKGKDHPAETVKTPK